jgi:hypothetical protein
MAKNNQIGNRSIQRSISVAIAGGIKVKLPKSLRKPSSISRACEGPRFQDYVRILADLASQWPSKN